MGKVIENHDFWEYHMMAATNVPEMMTGNKKWLSDPQRVRIHSNAAFQYQFLELIKHVLSSF